MRRYGVGCCKHGSRLSRCCGVWSQRHTHRVQRRYGMIRGLGPERLSPADNEHPARRHIDDEY